MNTALKGDDKKRNENCELKVLASREEIKYFLCCHGFYQESYQKKMA